jgi:hypothetical protein
VSSDLMVATLLHYITSDGEEMSQESCSILWGCGAPAPGLEACPQGLVGRLGDRARWIAGKRGVWYNGPIPLFVGAQAGERRTTVEDNIGIQQWMVLAFLFFLDMVVLGCLFLIAMNKIYLLP